jgi:hypothetical protein
VYYFSQPRDIHIYRFGFLSLDFYMRGNSYNKLLHHNDKAKAEGSSLLHTAVAAYVYEYVNRIPCSDIIEHILIIINQSYDYFNNLIYKCFLSLQWDKDLNITVNNDCRNSYFYFVFIFILFIFEILQCLRFHCLKEQIKRGINR